MFDSLYNNNMSTEKKKRRIGNKHIRVVTGILLILISLFCLLNYGYISTTIIFEMIYLFGNLYFLPFVGIILFGLRLMIVSDKKMKIKKRYIFSFVLLIFGLLMELTTFEQLSKDASRLTIFNFYTTFNQTIDLIGLNSGHPINLFNLSYGGGITGFLLIGGLNSLFTTYIVTFSFILFVFILIAFIIFFAPMKNMISVLSANRMKQIEAKKALKKEKEALELVKQKEEAEKLLIGQQEEEEKRKLLEIETQKEQEKEKEIQENDEISDEIVIHEEEKNEAIEDIKEEERVQFNENKVEFVAEENPNRATFEQNSSDLKDPFASIFSELHQKERHDDVEDIDEILIDESEQDDEENLDIDDDRKPIFKTEDSIAPDFGIEENEIILSNDGSENDSNDDLDQIIIEENDKKENVSCDFGSTNEQINAIDSVADNEDETEISNDETELLDESSKEQFNFSEKEKELNEKVNSTSNENEIEEGDGFEFIKYEMNGNYNPPSINIFKDSETHEYDEANIIFANKNMQSINEKLAGLHVGAEITSYIIGPSITQYNIVPNANFSISSLNRYIPDISLAAQGSSVRFQESVAGASHAAIEIENQCVSSASFKKTLLSLPIRKDYSNSDLTIPFGQNVAGDVISANFKKFPHMYVCGTSGSGKSVFVNNILVSLLQRNSPTNLRLLLIDPKKVEFSKYVDVPHLMCPPIKEANEAIIALELLVEEMENRYSIFEQTGCVNIEEYNEYAASRNLPALPFIVCAIDEYPDLVTVNKEIEEPLCRIGAKARASGIHLLIALQHPDANVLTARLKANIMTKVCLRVGTAINSKVAIDETGAQCLRGNGDMLVLCSEVSHGQLTRLQGPYLSNTEIRTFLDLLKERYKPQYNDKFMHLSEAQSYIRASNTGQYTYANGNDEKYREIREYSFNREYVSANAITQEFHVSFNNAKNYINSLIEDGIIEEVSVGALGRKVLIHSIDEYNDSKEDS